MKNPKIIASSGQRGDKVRSDCFCQIETNYSEGNEILIKSKVEVMYGKSIHKLASDIIEYFGIKNSKILIEDSGALPFIIAARIECAINRAGLGNGKEYLLPINKKNTYATAIDRGRRSRLYLPGNEPKFFINAGLHSPDGIILDLEDSVAPSEKDAAQLIVRNALRSVDFFGAERMVRINQFPRGLEDLKYIVPHNVNVILLPKAESADSIKTMEEEVEKLKKQHEVKNEIYFMPILESAQGIINAFEIAKASKKNCALAIGLEDYTADIGTQRTAEGRESYFARTMLVNAAKAAGIQAIDTVFSDVNDMEGLRISVLEAKSIGFEGKGCIHPRQIKVIHEAFVPTFDEIEKAKKIVNAFDDAKKKGLGVIALGSKMIDAPVVKRAQNTIKLAIENKLIPKNWNKN